MKDNSRLFIPLLGRAIMLTVFVTALFIGAGTVYEAVERTIDMPNFLTPSVLFVAMGTVFGGVVAALAIHHSFRLSAKEKRYELRIREHENLVVSVSELIGNSIAANTLPRLSETPSCAEQLERYKQGFFDLYSFSERNYTGVLISGVLFENTIKRNKQLREMEEKVISSQQQFAECYRHLYHSLHDYIDTSINGMNTLYEFIDNSGNLLRIWDEDIIHYTEQWDGMYGRNFGDELVSASQKQDELLASITQYAVETRDALAVFTEHFKSYERIALLYSRSFADEKDCNVTERLQAYKEYCSKHPI